MTQHVACAWGLFPASYMSFEELIIGQETCLRPAALRWRASILQPQALVLDNAGLRGSVHGVHGAARKGSCSTFMLWEISDAYGKQRLERFNTSSFQTLLLCFCSNSKILSFKEENNSVFIITFKENKHSIYLD